MAALSDAPEGLHKIGNRYEYVLKRNGKTFGVRQGENEILKYETWTATDPLIDFWNKPPKFKSFMQAVMWLKQNVDILN